MSRLPERNSGSAISQPFLLDIYLLLLVMGLLGIGLVIMQASTGDDAELKGHAAKQLTWILMCVPMLILLAKWDYRTLVEKSGWVYGLCLLLLLVVLIISRSVRGAQSWIMIPGINARLQPSELAKLGTLLVLARVIGKRQGHIDSLADLWPAMVLALIPSVLILAQRDLGTALLFPPLLLGMLWMGGIRPILFAALICPMGLAMLGLWPSLQTAVYGTTAGRVITWHDHTLVFPQFSTHLWALGVVLLLLALELRLHVRLIDMILLGAANVAAYGFSPWVWAFLEPHQKDRLTVFLQPESDLSKAGYNLLQSKVALGSGGMWGKGLKDATQIQLHFLPEFHTDFIFPVVGEQWGFVGCMVVLTLFFLLLLRGMETARTARNLNGYLLAGGISLLIFLHLTINVGMSMGLLPVTGLPLSFLSYGGSFMVVNLAAIGLLINVRLRKFG